jgi:tellurite resistance protein TerA
MGDDRLRGVIRLPDRAGERFSRPARTERAEPPPTTLTTASPAVRLAGRGRLQVNLNWRPGHRVDLDLGCLVSFADGGTAVVQALGEAWGSLATWPYVALDQDDRTGATSDGETLRVSLEHAPLFRRLLIYAYVYEGAVDFRRLGATVTVTAPAAAAGYRIPLDDSPPGVVACAVAQVTAERDGLTVRREARWFAQSPEEFIQQSIDRAYGFGMTWSPGTKPPL